MTGIDPYVLAGGNIRHVPIARRMFWASERHCTRLKDVVYSLLGIFDVSLPIIYGEREKAFIRLQEELARTLYDPTLFAWNPTWTKEYWTPDVYDSVVRSRQLRDHLAKSPQDFRRCGEMFPPFERTVYDVINQNEPKDLVYDRSKAHSDNDLSQMNLDRLTSSDMEDPEWDTTSVASFGSATTLVEDSHMGPVQSGMKKAVSFFGENETLSPLFTAAVHKRETGVGRLRRNFARMLRQFSTELFVEATTKEETDSAAFIRHHRLSLATAITLMVAEKQLPPPVVDQIISSDKVASKIGLADEGMSSETRRKASNLATVADATTGALKEPLSDFEIDADEVDPEDEADHDEETAVEKKDEVADIDFDSLVAFILASVAFQNMTKRLADFVHPSFRSQTQTLISKLLEGKDVEHDRYWATAKTKMQTVVTEIEESLPESIMLETKYKMVLLDRFQVWVESVTGETWNWWPLRPPKYPFDSSAANIEWRCVSLLPKL